MDNDVSSLVSVIISCYNHQEYVEQSILSVLSQDHNNIELLVVDDGSSDRSVEVISRLQEKYGFYFISQDNKGLTRTLNETIKKSKGEYIVPFASDDIMTPGRISIQVEYMKDKPEVGICGGNVELIDSEGKPYPDSKQSINTPFRRLDFEDVFLESKAYVPAPTMFFRRNALEEVGCYDENNRLDDVTIKLRVTKAGYYIDCIPVVLAKYRRHETNISKDYGFIVESVLDVYDKYIDHPDYEFVKFRFLNSFFLKVANRDRALAKSILKGIPLAKWNKKTWRGVFRLCFSPLKK